ncbi:hypothetical protein EIZ88_23855 [Escherichia coli]|nr:hypothetical protein [Escherichia coli]MQK65762.1 hypothetical protein [Escherichia coli]
MSTFHYRSYGTFCIYSKRLHNFHGGFTHYRNYRAAFSYVRRACRTSEVKVLRGHPLPVNPKATPKPDYREVAGRGRDSEIVALRTET